MSNFIIKNVTGADIELDDLGITVSANGTYDLLGINYHEIARSFDLDSAIVSNTIVFLDSDGITSLDQTSSEAILTKKFDSNSVAPIVGTETAKWGNIDGVLSDQIELQTVLDQKSVISHDHSGVYELTFAKNNAFNKNFGSISGTIAEGNQPGLLLSQHESSFNHPAFTTHLTNLNNPHDVTQTQVGLGNVDNTNDASKPVSIATQTALDSKADIGSGGGGNPVKICMRTNGYSSQTLDGNYVSINLSENIRTDSIYTVTAMYNSYHRYNYGCSTSHSITVNESGWYKISYTVTVDDDKKSSAFKAKVTVDNDSLKYSYVYGYLYKHTNGSASKSFIVQLNSGQVIQYLAAETKGRISTKRNSCTFLIEQLEIL